MTGLAGYMNTELPETQSLRSKNVPPSGKREEEITAIPGLSGKVNSVKIYLLNKLTHSLAMG